MRLALSEAMEIAVQPLAQMVEDFGKPMQMYDGDWAIFCPCCELWLRDFSQYLHHVKLDRHRRRSEVIRTRQEIRRLRRAQRPAKATSPPLQPLAGNLVQGELAAMEAALAISEAFEAARCSAFANTSISRRLVPPQELAAMKAALATGEATRAARSSAIGETFIAGQESASATGEASEAARSSAIDEKVIVRWPNWPTERRRRPRWLKVWGSPGGGRILAYALVWNMSSRCRTPRHGARVAVLKQPEVGHRRSDHRRSEFGCS